MLSFRRLAQCVWTLLLQRALLVASDDLVVTFEADALAEWGLPADAKVFRVAAASCEHNAPADQKLEGTVKGKNAS